MRSTEYNLLQDIANKFSPITTCFSLGSNFQLNFNESQFSTEIAQLILEKMSSSQEPFFSFTDYQNETQLEGSIEQISSFIQEQKIQLEFEGDVKIEFASLQNEKYQEEINNFIGDPNCSSFAREFLIQTIEHLRSVMNQFEEEEEGNEAMQKVLKKLKGRLSELFQPKLDLKYSRVKQENKNLKRLVADFEKQMERMKLLLQEKERKEQAMSSFLEEMKFNVMKLGEDNLEFEKEILLRLFNNPAEASLSSSDKKEVNQRFLPFQDSSLQTKAKNDSEILMEKEIFGFDGLKVNLSEKTLQMEFRRLIEEILQEKIDSVCLDVVQQAQIQLKRYQQLEKKLRKKQEFICNQNLLISENRANTVHDEETQEQRKIQDFGSLLGVDQRNVQVIEQLIRRSQSIYGRDKTAEMLLGCLKNPQSNTIVGKQENLEVLMNMLRRSGKVSKLLVLLENCTVRMSQIESKLSMLEPKAAQLQRQGWNEVLEKKEKQVCLLKEKNQSLLEQIASLNDNQQKLQEEISFIEFQKIALEKRINLQEDEDNDLLNSKNSEKQARLSSDVLIPQPPNDFQGFKNHDSKLDSVDEEVDSQLVYGDSRGSEKQIAREGRRKLKMAKNYHFSNHGRINLFNESVCGSKKKSKSNIFSQADIFKELKESSKKSQLRTNSLPRMPFKKQVAVPPVNLRIQGQNLKRKCDQLALNFLMITKQEKKVKKIKERLLYFQNNLRELKECLQDNNLDMAKERMSVCKGLPDRQGTLPNYQYSDEENENSFEVRRESTAYERRKSFIDAKQLQAYLEQILKISFELIENDVQQVEPQQLNVQQIPDILKIVDEKVKTLEKEKNALKEKLSAVVSEKKQEQNNHDDQVFQKLLKELSQQSSQSQTNVELIYQLIIKMVDEDQEFTENDEGKLSRALDDAKESNQNLKELIDFLNSNLFSFLQQANGMSKKQLKQLEEIKLENNELKKTLEMHLSQNQSNKSNMLKSQEGKIQQGSSTRERNKMDEENQDFAFEELRLSQNPEFLSREFKKHIQKILSVAQEKKGVNFQKFCLKLEEAVVVLNGNLLSIHQSEGSLDVKLDQYQSQTSHQNKQITQQQVELENENYILKDKVEALEQQLKLKDDQISIIKHASQEDETEKKIKKLNAKLLAMKSEGKKDQELIEIMKEKLNNRDDKIKVWQQRYGNAETHLLSLQKQLMKQGTKKSESKEVKEVVMKLHEQNQQLLAQCEEYKLKLLSYKNKLKRGQSQVKDSNVFDNESIESGRGMSIRKKAEIILLANDLRQKDQKIKRLQEQLKQYKDLYQDELDKSCTFSQTKTTRHRKSPNTSNVSHKRG